MKYLILRLLSFLLISSCKKEEKFPYPLSELPEATQRGAETIGCLVNGEPWVAGYDSITFLSSSYITSTYDLENNYSNDDFLWRINAKHFFKDLNFDRINFAFKPLTKTGVISPGDQVQVMGTPYFKNAFYVIDTLLPYKFNITYIGYEKFVGDWRRRIVAGTFEFYCTRESDQKDTLHITDGRFDATYSLQ